jgi:hypothetical protein
MAFPILGANTESAAFDVTNSLRFNSNDSPKLQETTGSNSNRRKFTFSTWVKKCQDMGEDQTLFSANDGGHQPHIKFDNEYEQLNVRISDSAGYNVMTQRQFNDPAAWYHIVVAMDTTQSTASNRIKIYVNGVQETSLRTANYPTQDYDSAINSNTEHTVGRDVTTNNKPLDGYLAETYFVDGSQLDPTYFGKFNSDGIWIPVEKGKGAGGSISFGTHGFYFEYKQTGTGTNSSGIGADTSGNDNHLAVTNLAATDVTTDTPTNNFATMNPLDNFYAGQTFREGNCQIITGNSQSTFSTSTIGVTKGKWYWEVKIIDKATGSDQTSIGVQGGVSPGTTDQIGYNTRGHQLRSNGNTHTNGGNSTYMASLSDNDIVMVAFDRDNESIYFGANGQWGDGSGNTDEANPTSAKGISVADDDFVFAALGDMTGSDTCTYEINFGNPPFSISSGNADANGHGNFEYAVPTNYFALCTKNLAENG